MRIGDVVKLKSGGPKMTVYSLSGDDDMVNCVWFSDAHQDVSRATLREDNEPFPQMDFPIDALEIVRAQAPKRKPKLLVTERDSDMEAAKHELEAYLKKAK